MKPRTAATLSAAVLAVAAATASAADLLVHNVNGYTLDQAGELRRFEALLVRDGKVLATGPRTELAARARDAQQLDGQGRGLLPGLVDAHGHIMGLGYSRTQVDLVGTRSLA
ncbi:MAG: imidazolonepropionase-like domain-containing protein, partial [Nevskiaceae bacterium]